MRASIPKRRRRRCKRCRGERVETWDIRTDSVKVELVSYDEDIEHGRRSRHDYCNACLRLAGLTDEIDRRVNAQMNYIPEAHG